MTNRHAVARAAGAAYNTVWSTPRTPGAWSLGQLLARKFRREVGGPALPEHLAAELVRQGVARAIDVYCEEGDRKRSPERSGTMFNHAVSGLYWAYLDDYYDVSGSPLGRIVADEYEMLFSEDQQLTDSESGILSDLSAHNLLVHATGAALVSYHQAWQGHTKPDADAAFHRVLDLLADDIVIAIDEARARDAAE